MTDAITGLKTSKTGNTIYTRINRHEMNTKTGDSHVGYEWIALSVTTIGVLMASIDGSAVIIALPTILADLQASFITMMWVLLGYLLIVAAIVPVVGRLCGE